MDTVCTWRAVRMTSVAGSSLFSLGAVLHAAGEGLARNAEVFFFAPKPYDYQYHQQSLWQ